MAGALLPEARGRAPTTTTTTSRELRARGGGGRRRRRASPGGTSSLGKGLLQPQQHEAQHDAPEDREGRHERVRDDLLEEEAGVARAEELGAVRLRRRGQEPCRRPEGRGRGPARGRLRWR